MRIAVLYWARRKFGGTEAYIENIILELLGAGHQVAFWHEADGPGGNERINLPEGVPVWCVEDLGTESALAALRGWSPDVIFTHCLMNLRLEVETLKIAPAVFFAHAYYGTCISGNKTFRKPIATPCHRRFGWKCLAHYYPHRCGGLSPFTMVKEYSRQSRRLKQLSIYKAIVTHSSYMRAEYVNHGFEPDRVHWLSYCRDSEVKTGENASRCDSSIEHRQVERNVEGSIVMETPDVWRLLFLGRMGFLKGGNALLDALPYVSLALDRPLRVTFAGEGPDRNIWEDQAAQVKRQRPGIEIEFLGWLSGHQLEALWNETHLLVLPSVWPEPFGMVGPEAGLHGVPAAGFAVGGISDWLRDGVNGYLASGNPPSSRNLASAIVKCLHDPEEYARLRHGALSFSRQFKIQTHLFSLLKVFERVVAEC